MPGLLGVSLLSCVHFGALLEPTSNRFFKTFDKLRFRALHPQLRHWQVRGNRDSVWGRRAGSRIIRLPRLLGEGPMGKPVAHPQDLLYLCTNAKLYGVGGWAKINIGGIIGGNDSMR